MKIRFMSAVTGDLVELNEQFNLYWRRIIPLSQTSIAEPTGRERYHRKVIVILINQKN